MPTVLKMGGHRFFFFSNEGTEAPHIHVESGDKYAKFWLNPIILARSVGYSARDLTEVHRIIEENRGVIEGKWHEFFGS